MRCFLRLAGFFLPLLALATSHPDRAQELRATNQAYNAALIAGDVPALERIFAEELVYTSPRGEIMNRAAQLEIIRSKTLRIETATGSDEQVRLYGETGIVTGRFEAQGTFKQQPFHAIERYTSVWVLRDGRWQLVAEQGTLLPKS